MVCDAIQDFVRSLLELLVTHCGKIS